MGSLYKIPRELLDAGKNLHEQCNTTEIKALAKEIHDLLALLKNNNSYLGIANNFSTIKESGKSVIQKLTKLEVTDDTRNDIFLLANFFSDVSKLHGQKKFTGTVLEKETFTIEILGMTKTANLKDHSERFHDRIQNKIERFDKKKSRLPIGDFENKQVAQDLVVSSQDEKETALSASISKQHIPPSTASTSLSSSGSQSDSNEEPYEIIREKKSSFLKQSKKELQRIFLKVFESLEDLLDEFDKQTKSVQDDSENISVSVHVQKTLTSSTGIEKSKEMKSLLAESKKESLQANILGEPKSVNPITQQEQQINKYLDNMFDITHLTNQATDSPQASFEDNVALLRSPQKKGEHKHEQNLVAHQENKKESWKPDSLFIGICLVVPVLGWIILAIAYGVSKALEPNAEIKDIQDRDSYKRISPGN